MDAIPECGLGPFQRFFLAGFILRHLLVSRIQFGSDDVRAHEFLDKLTDLARPDYLMEAFVDLLFDGDRQLFLHGELLLAIYTCIIRIGIRPVKIRRYSIVSLTPGLSCGPSGTLFPREQQKKREREGAVSFKPLLDGM